MRSNKTVRIGGLAIMAALAAMPVTGLALTPLSALLTPGKEYSNLIDQTAGGAPLPGNVVSWNGAGGAVDGGVLAIPGATNIEVDALANTGDAFYQQVAFFNSAALLFSIAGDPGNAGNPAGKIAVHAEDDLGGMSIWAYNNIPGPTVNGLAGTVNDLDGLEVWGPDFDTNAFSIFGDGAGIAVYDLAGGALVTTAQLVTMLIPFGLGPNDRVDLDALMMGFNDGAVSILFSIRANGTFDGGEIWVGNVGTLTASYLLHGGRVWDTANNVAALTQCNTEEIDALEATELVPEPASMAALGIGALGLLRRRAKKA